VKGHRRAVSCLKALPYNKYVSGSWDNTIKIWLDNQCLTTLEGHTDLVRTIELISSYKLASGSSDGTIRLWDLNAGVCIKVFNDHEARSVNALVLVNNILNLKNNEQQLLLSSNSDKRLKSDKKLIIWDLIRGECTRTISVEKEILKMELFTF